MRFYTDFAEWWPLLSKPEDYAEEAGIYIKLLQKAADGPIRSVLELGSGGGNNASYFRQEFEEVVLSDLSEGMLAVSRALNPGCEHHLGDMRDLRLGRTFDAVFVHDAICYMTTPNDLDRLAETIAIHCRPGGAVLLAPDFVSETFRSDSEEGGHDEDFLDVPTGAPVGSGADRHPRGLRYLAWSWDPDPTDTTYLTDFAFLMREGDGSVAVHHDRHVEGLFSRSQWLSCLEGVGFAAQCLPVDLDDPDWSELEVFVGRKRETN